MRAHCRAVLLARAERQGVQQVFARASLGCGDQGPERMATSVCCPGSVLCTHLALNSIVLSNVLDTAGVAGGSGLATEEVGWEAAGAVGNSPVKQLIMGRHSREVLGETSSKLKSKALAKMVDMVLREKSGQPSKTAAANSGCVADVKQQH